VTASIEVTLDAVDDDAAVAFWTAALGYHVLYARGAYTVLGPSDHSGGPRLLIQRVDAVSNDKTRMHLDLRVDDPDAEVARLRALGATVAWEIDESEENDPGCVRWTVMRDPHGMHFCVCPARQPIDSKGT
jgi:catechol 2,3-dioxygenase-like lactoylglutathione lyase family enzyme